jgi:hypothetical protein
MQSTRRGTCSLLFAFLASGYAAKASAQAEQPTTTKVPPTATPASPAATPQATNQQTPTDSTKPQLFTGVIRDSATAEPIVGATVTVDSSTELATVRSDNNGEFALTAPLGATLFVDAAGYETNLASLDSQRITVIMVALDSVGETIEIKASAPRAVSGSASLSREEMSTLPGTGGDLLASVSILPGVTTPSAFSPAAGAGVIVRGSSPRDSRIVIDGFDVPLLYHSLLGRSIIPTVAVENLEYQPGGFDVRYGGASAGLISVTSRGGGDKLQGSAEVSFIDANLVASGPINRKSRFMLSLRRSYVDAYLGSVIPKDAGVTLLTAPRYYDGLLRLDYQPSQRWNTALTIVGSDDLLKLLATGAGDNSSDITFRQNTRFLRTIGSAKWYRPDGVSAHVAASALLQDFDVSAGKEAKIGVGQIRGTLRAEATKSTAQWIGLTDVVFRAGSEIDIGRFSIDVDVDRPATEGDPSATTGPAEGGPKVKFVGTQYGTNVGAWGVVEASLSAKLRLQVGLRADGYTRGGSYPVQPRGELKFAVTNKTKLRLAAGRYTRPPEDQDEYLDKTLAPESSAQITLGGEHTFANNLNVQLTAYDSERTNLITRDESGAYKNQGRGRTFGLETLATWRNAQWFTWVAYTLSRSTRIDAPAMQERRFDYDQTHNLVAATSFKSRNQKWILGGKFQFTSGSPYTPVTGAIFNSDLNSYTPKFGTVNSMTTDAHHQLDLRVDRIWQIGSRKVAAFLDVSNVYVNQSVVQYEYSYDYKQRGSIKSLPIVPSLGIRGEL